MTSQDTTAEMSRAIALVRAYIWERRLRLVIGGATAQEAVQAIPIAARLATRSTGSIGPRRCAPLRIA
jgi:hypothetical protein